MKVEELMSQPVVTCRPRDSLNAAAKLLWDHDCGAVPVVDDQGVLNGMITDRDICMSAYTRGVGLSDIAVADAMAKDVFACRPQDSLDSAERVMSEKQVRRLPVVNDDDRPVGFISLNDIARFAAASRKKNGLDREVTRTLAAICEPRTTLDGSEKEAPSAAVERASA